MRPTPTPGAEHVLFFTHGEATVTINGTGPRPHAGGYAYIPAGAKWTLLAEGPTPPASTGSASFTSPPPACPPPPLS